MSVELALVIGGELITFKAETYYDKRLGQYLTGHKELDMMAGFGLHLEAKYVGSGEKYQTVRELLTRACLRAFNREPGFFPITSSGVLMGYVEGAGDASAFRISLEDVYDEYYKEVYGESLPRGLEPGSNPGPEHNLHPYLAEQEKEAGTEPLRAGRGVESIDNTPKEAKQEGAQVPTRADGQADGNYTASKTPETPLFCFQCGEPITGSPFYCKYCGEALCELHKKPESHYCLPFREKHPMETVQRRFAPHYHEIHAHDNPWHPHKNHRKRNAAIIAGVILLLVLIVIPVAASDMGQISTISTNSTSTNSGTHPAVTPPSGFLYGTGSPISSSGPSDQQLSLYLSSPTSSQAYYPVGISSIGVYNTGQAYTIRTGSLAGIAMINALGTTAQSDGASLQLNAVIVINNSNGTQSTLWSQDVVQFTGSQAYYESSITQDTGPSVTFSESGASYLQNLYVYSTYQTSYKLPFDLLLVMNVSMVPGGVQVSFTEESITGLTASNNMTLNYEYSRAAPYSTVFVGDPEASAAYFLISGQSVISYPDNTMNFYDAELVFGGPGSGSTAVFTSMDAQLYLFYSYSEAYYYFPTYFNYGFSTAESASGIQSALNSGMANVTLGTFQAEGPT